VTTKEEQIEQIKTYTDSQLSRRTISVAYRCNKCGVIWRKLKDIQGHVLTCNKGNKHGQH
jgi:uncharacterized C2H2 Zn-finger protein